MIEKIEISNKELYELNEHGLRALCGEIIYMLNEIIDGLTKDGAL